MEKIDFYLPTIELESFKKFVEKTKKNLPQLVVNINDKIEKKIYIHGNLDEDNHVFFTKMMHEVVFVSIELPVISDWILLVTYEDGFEFITNPKEKLELHDNHGKTYNKCDVCKHWCKNSHVIRNIKTNKELQVGSECLKKFGIGGISFVSKFTRELDRIFKDYCSSITDGDYLVWKGQPDKYAFSTCETLDLLKAAKAYYNNNKVWKRGYYDNDGRYIKSESNEKIQSNLLNKIFDGDEEYFNKVKQYFIETNKSDNEFSLEMLEMCNNYYSTPANASHAYFLIKNYEDYLKSKDLKLEIYEGKQIHIFRAKIIQKEKYETAFGVGIEYTLEASNGLILKRFGKIPIDENNDNLTGEFYALVKFVNKNKSLIELDRATKNPKKGIDTIELF